MTEILQDWTEKALIAAIEDNLIAMLPGLFGNFPNVDFHDDPDLTWLATDVSYPLCNSVFRTQLAPGDADARIAQVVAHFKARRLPMIWWVGPSTQPADLPRLLQTRGLIHLDDNPGMAIDLGQAQVELTGAPGAIKRVSNPGELKKWVHPIAATFEFPDTVTRLYVEALADQGFDENGQWQHYAAYLDGEVVGASSMFLGAGVAGIYNVAVLPSARRKGVGTALTQAPLSNARARGYRVGILHSTDEGFNLYQRIGFKEYCTISHYVYLPNWAQRALLRVYVWAQRLRRRGRG